MKMILLLKRKPGITAEEFKNYYESNHAPMATKYLHFGTYKRYYIDKENLYEAGHVEHAAPLPDYDVVVEIGFDSPDDYQKMMDVLGDPVSGKQFADDEANFLDRDSLQMFFVDEYETPVAELAAAKAKATA
jgi:uncharacterized protein (TIGR02118 family)